jgi:hypothetical protein
MIRQVYIWRHENEWPVHRSIQVETPLGSEPPKYIQVFEKYFQRSGVLLKGLHLYIEIEVEP